MRNTICALLPWWVHAWKKRFRWEKTVWQTKKKFTSPDLVLKVSPEEKNISLKVYSRVLGFLFFLLTLQLRGSNPAGVDSTPLWSKLITCYIYCLFTPVASDVHVCMFERAGIRGHSAAYLYLEFCPVRTVLIVTTGCILLFADLPECTQMVPWTSEASGAHISPLDWIFAL